MFRKEQKIQVAKAVVRGVKNGEVFPKQAFQDTLLGVDVGRYELKLAGEYVGRDSVVITPIGEFDEVMKGMRDDFSNADVRNVSEQYKLISNTQVKDQLTKDIEDIYPETDFVGKKESFTDFSGLFTFEDEQTNVILFRNSYIPGRSLQILLGVKDAVIIPLMAVRYIHTAKNLKVELEEEVKKLSDYYKIIDVLKALEPVEDDLRALKLIVEKSVRWDKDGNRIEKIRETGAEILKEALKQKTYWEAIQTIVRMGYKRPYTVKRRIDKFCISLFDWLLKGKPVREEEIVVPFAF